MSSEFRHRASLVLNVVLAVTAVVLALHKSEPAAPAAPVKMANGTPVFTRQPKTPQYPGVASTSDQRRWLVDQLRAMGVPNDTLARIVLESLDKEWNRYSAKVSLECHGDGDTLDALQLKIDMGMDDQVRAALGEAGFREWDQKKMLQEAMRTRVALTDSEADAIYDLKKKQQQRFLDLRQAMQKGEMDKSDVQNALATASSEFTGQMKAILGDERYAESQGLDPGVVATNLQQDLAKATPSDSQFQDLLKAQQQLNDARSKLDQQIQDDPSQSAAYDEQIKALDDARDQKYRQVLGTNVFDTLQMEQDGGYSKMVQYKNLWGLDDSEIYYVYATMQYYEKSGQDYQAQASALQAQGQSVDWDAVNKNLQQLKQQTQQTLQNYLGQDRFNQLQQNGVFYQFNQVAHH